MNTQKAIPKSMTLTRSGKQDSNLRPLVPNQVLYQAELFPDKNAPSRSRTCNLLIRSQTLYPVALWVHNIKYSVNAEDRNRTGTVITHRRILSPVRLPVPPPRRDTLITSGRRDSNPRPPPWQGGVLPLNYFRINGAD